MNLNGLSLIESERRHLKLLPSRLRPVAGLTAVVAVKEARRLQFIASQRSVKFPRGPWLSHFFSITCLQHSFINLSAATLNPNRLGE